MQDGHMIKVHNEVPTYKDDLNSSHDTPVFVDSHWNYDDRVYLIIGDKKVCVVGRDLQTAITNAMNIRRH